MNMFAHGMRLWDKLTANDNKIDIPSWALKPNARRRTRTLILDYLSDFDCAVPQKVILASIAIWRKDIPSTALRNQLWFLYKDGCVDRSWVGRETYYSITPKGRVSRGKNSR